MTNPVTLKPTIGRALPGKGNARSSGYERHGDDWYREPPRAVEALLDMEMIDGAVWDPACGGGNIPAVCKTRGIDAVGSDIIDRGGCQFIQDFLVSNRREDNIITNPPFSLAVQFVLHALSRTRHKIAVLQRTTWLEGERRYQSLFRDHPPARIWQFRSRISMPPGDSNAEAKGGSVAFAWFVWSHDHSGPPTFGWLP